MDCLATAAGRTRAWWTSPPSAFRRVSSLWRIRLFYQKRPLGCLLISRFIYRILDDWIKSWTMMRFLRRSWRIRLSLILIRSVWWTRRSERGFNSIPLMVSIHKEFKQNFQFRGIESHMVYSLRTTFQVFVKSYFYSQFFNPIEHQNKRSSIQLNPQRVQLSKSRLGEITENSTPSMLISTKESTCNHVSN